MNTTKIPWDPLQFLFMMDDALQEMIYYEWGFFFNQKGMHIESIQYTEKSLAKCPTEAEPTELENELEEEIVQVTRKVVVPKSHQYLLKSRAELAEGLVKESLDTIERGLILNPDNPVYRLQKLECLFYDRQIEGTYVIAVNEKEHSTFRQKFELQKLIEEAKYHLQCSIGVDAGPCLVKQINAIRHLQKLPAVVVIDEKPRWRRLKDEKKCDVESVVEEEDVYNCPLDHKRMKFDNNLINQKYFRRTAVDIEFLRKLKNDDRLQADGFDLHNQKLLNIIDTCQKKVMNCRKCLQAQQPLYSLKYLQFQRLSEASVKRANQVHFMAAANRARIRAFNHLEQIHIRKYKLSELSKFVEDIMNKFYSIQTRRILPRKFEIMNEIFNIYALTLLSTLKIPVKVDDYPPIVALLKTLDPKHNVNENLLFSTFVYDEMAAFDKSVNKAAIEKTHLMRERTRRLIGFRKRATCAEYAIEKCYLHYMIATYAYRLGKYQEAYEAAVKVVCLFGAEIGHWVWRFLGLLMVFKVNALLNKQDRYLKCLAVGKEIVVHLDEPTRRYYTVVEFYTEKILLEKPKMLEYKAPIEAAPAPVSPPVSPSVSPPAAGAPVQTESWSSDRKERKASLWIPHAPSIDSKESYAADVPSGSASIELEESSEASSLVAASTPGAKSWNPKKKRKTFARKTGKP